LEAGRKVSGDDSPNTALIKHNLGFALASSTQPISQARADEIEALYRQAETTFRTSKSTGDGTELACRVTLHLGQFLAERKRYQEAETVFQNALARLSTLPVAPSIWVENYVSALDALYKIWDQPERAAAWKLKRLVPMETVLRRLSGLLRAQPNDPELLRSYGSMLVGLARFGEGEAAYRAAILLKPDDADLYHALAGACEWQGRIKEAEAGYREALRLSPNDAWRHDHLGQCVRKQHKYAEAVVEFTEAIRLRAGKQASHFGPGGAYSGKANGAEAAAFEEAIKFINPSELLPIADTLGMLAITLREDGKPAAAEPLGHQALAIVRMRSSDPASIARVTHDLAFVLMRIPGREVEAEQFYRQALEMRRQALGEGDAATVDTAFRLAQLLGDQGKFDQAEELLREAYASLVANKGSAAAKEYEPVLLKWIVEQYRGWKMLEKASEWERKLPPKEPDKKEPQPQKK
jgi:tetratricopeptide (TPR) repeat protein